MLRFLIILQFVVAVARAQTLDMLTFGDTASETAHGLSTGWGPVARKSLTPPSDVVVGGLGESARRLLPPATNHWEGGRMAFTLKVDPDRLNYATIRLWGSDKTVNQLILFCEGKQIGYRHLGDIDLLDIGSGEPAFNGRFFYNTTPLPVELTRGRTNLNFEIRSLGQTWGYGQTFDKYQKPMTEPTRGIYRLYTHTDGFFAPPADEKQGDAPKNPPVRKEPGPGVLDQVKQRVNGEIAARLDAKRPISQMQMQLLANAYDVEWTRAHQNPQAIEQIVKALDALFAAYRLNPRLAQEEPSTWNPGWFGLGICGQVIALRKAELSSQLDGQIDDGHGGKVTRRAAYTEMLVACRDWHRKHRRQYTNQTMLNDLNGIYHANRGIAALNPGQALHEADARRYLYEAVGLEPWRDSDSGGGAALETGRRNWGVGTNYWQLTAKGLSKELGYVGSYGEVIDLIADIYNATRPAPGEPGDERIKAQLTKVARARANFRYPSLDEDGNRVMRLEQVVGWRDAHYPGYLTYAQRATRDACALQAAAITLDPQLVGCAQQMIADNQFFASEVGATDDKAQPLRTTIGRLETPGCYEIIKAQAPQAKRLPMSPGQPDFVFSDEEDGVVAIKNGDEILYASLYWRARNAVNFLARIHYTTSRLDRIAVVREEVEFEPSGMTYTRPDWINFGFGNGGPHYPQDLHSASAGEKLPIAKIPDGVPFRPGSESVYAGKGEFYALRYGDYLIGMNVTTDKTFELKPPEGVGAAQELVSGKTLNLTAPLKVGPRSTAVLWLKN